MSKFNRYFFYAIAIVALLPLIPSVIAGAIALSPVMLVIALFFGITAFRPLKRGAKGIGWLVGMFAMIFQNLFSAFYWLLGGDKQSVRFMGWFERAKLLSSSNTGFLVDGKSSRLAETATYESLLVQGGMGRGKSSTFVMPNLLDPPSTEPSFVISDTSGEIYKNTSGYLAKRGYQIRVLNLMDPTRSETYNPLAKADTPAKIAELAKTLVTSSNPGQGSAHDPFWNQAAEKLIRILVQCLANQGDPKLRTLANLRHLVTGFDAHTAKKGQLGGIDQFVLDATQNDPQTFQSYRAFVEGNLKTIQSILMSADVALDGVATPEIAKLTGSNSLDFGELRQRKTALYIMVNQTQMDLYAFLLNLFYSELFGSLLKDEQNPGRPVWLFLDEFGHLQIPGFEIFATTARKYKIGFALFLQSLAQLDARYGRQKATILREALGTEIYMPGMALDTARELEARMGRKKSGPLMAANDIIRMDEDEALMLISNKLPVMLDTKRYYKRGDLKRRANRTPAPLPAAPINMPTLSALHKQPAP